MSAQVAAPHPTNHRGIPGREAEEMPRMYPEDAPRMCLMHSPPVAAPHLTTHRGAPGREAEDAPRMYVDAHSVSGTPGGRSPRRCPV
jgi:hypothetical protein